MFEAARACDWLGSAVEVGSVLVRRRPFEKCAVVEGAVTMVSLAGRAREMSDV